MLHVYRMYTFTSLIFFSKILNFQFSFLACWTAFLTKCMDRGFMKQPLAHLRVEILQLLTRLNLFLVHKNFHFSSTGPLHYISLFFSRVCMEAVIPTLLLTSETPRFEQTNSTFHVELNARRSIQTFCYSVRCILVLTRSSSGLSISLSLRT